MLILRRKNGDYVDVTHGTSGDVLRIWTSNVRWCGGTQVDMGFDDPAHNFQIQRSERKILHAREEPVKIEADHSKQGK